MFSKTIPSKWIANWYCLYLPARKACVPE